MPTSVPLPPVTIPNLPITELSGFLNEVEGLLDNITGAWSQLLFEDDDRQPLLDAWNDLRFNRLPTIRDQLASASENSLRDAGLSGPQLTAKLNWLNNAWWAFRLRGTVPLLKKVLEWIDLILGSLVAVIPAAEPLKELKEAIEKLIQQG